MKRARHLTVSRLGSRHCTPDSFSLVMLLKVRQKLLRLVSRLGRNLDYIYIAQIRGPPPIASWSHDEATLRRNSRTVGFSHIPCSNSGLSGWIWTSFSRSVCLVHERQHHYCGAKKWTVQFPCRRAFRDSRPILCQRQLLCKPHQSVQTASFPPDDLLCRRRAACDCRCSRTPWPFECRC